MNEPNFHYHLTGVPAIAALVGGRVFPDMVKQGSLLPAIVFQRTGTLRQQTYCGTHGLVLGNFQIDVYAKTRNECRTLAALVLKALIDYAGPMGTDCDVKHCALQTDFDSVDPDPGTLRRTQLWAIWYPER